MGEGVVVKEGSKHALVLDGLAVPQQEVNSGTIPQNEVGRWLCHCPSILYGLGPPRRARLWLPPASWQRECRTMEVRNSVKWGAKRSTC